MDNTRLHVYPRCFGGHADKGKRKKVNLKQGTVLFFRGDLAHAGAKYDGLNIRLHFYVQIAGLSQEQNATEAVVFQTFRCDKCLKIAYTRKELAAHRRTCSERGLLKCPYQGCTVTYAVHNSLNVHIGRVHKKHGHKLAVEEKYTGEEDDEEEEEEEKEEEEEEGEVESGSSGEDTVVFDTENSNDEESEYSGEESDENDEYLAVAVVTRYS
ncbi:hypothetical protein DVH05_000908 [Phytophthora capsici]|nr:hypothetical protein DVH05_000908 [Phytophthora capsici]